MGINYIKKAEGGNWTATIHKPKFGQADPYSDFYVDGKWYQPSQMITNGLFDSDISGWTFDNGGTGTAIWKLYNTGASRGIVELNQGATSTWMSFYQTITTVVGQKYRLKVSKFEATTGNTKIGVGTNAPVTNTQYTGNIYASVATTSAVEYDIIFTATGTTIYIVLQDGQGISQVSRWDDISVTPLDSSQWTAYTTPITYLPYTVEADAEGNPADIQPFDVPDVVVNSINTKELTGLDKPMYKGQLASNITATGLILPWSTSFDTHNAMNGGIYTAPKTGYYTINATVLSEHTTTATTINCELHIDGTFFARSLHHGESTGCYYGNLVFTHMAYIEEGQTLYLLSNSASAAHRIAADTSSHLSIEYIGDNFNAS